MEQDNGQGFEPRTTADVFGPPSEAAKPVESVGARSEPVATPEPAATVEQPTETPAQPRQPDGKFAPKPKDAPATTADKDDAPIPRAALMDERRKRQEYERKVAEYERRIADMEAKLRAPAPVATPPGDAKPADPLDKLLADPAAFVGEHISTVREEIRATKAEMAAEMMRSVHPDYDDAEKAIFDYVTMAEASGDPAKVLEARNIRAAIASAPNPARIAYQLGRQARAVLEHGGDPAAMYQAQIEAEVERRLAERMAAQAPQPAQPSPVPSLPQSLAAARSAAPRAGAAAWNGPRPTSAIFGGPRR